MEPSQILNEFHALDTSSRVHMGAGSGPRVRAPKFQRPGLPTVHEIGGGGGIDGAKQALAQAASAIEKSSSGESTASRFGWQFWVISALVLLAVGLIAWKAYQKYCEWRDKKKASAEAEDLRKKQAEETQQRMQKARLQRVAAEEQARAEEQRRRMEQEEQEQEEQERGEQEQEEQERGEQEQEEQERGEQEHEEGKEHADGTKTTSSGSDSSTRRRRRRQRKRARDRKRDSSSDDDDDMPSPVEQAAKRAEKHVGSDHNSETDVKTGAQESGGGGGGGGGTLQQSPATNKHKEGREDPEQDSEQDKARSPEQDKARSPEQDKARSPEQDKAQEQEQDKVQEQEQDRKKSGSFTELSEVELL